MIFSKHDVGMASSPGAAGRLNENACVSMTFRIVSTGRRGATQVNEINGPGDLLAAMPAWGKVFVGAQFVLIAILLAVLVAVTRDDASRAVAMPTLTATNTPTPVPTATATHWSTSTPTATATPTPTPTKKPTSTPVPTFTPTWLPEPEVGAVPAPALRSSFSSLLSSNTNEARKRC